MSSVLLIKGTKVNSVKAMSAAIDCNPFTKGNAWVALMNALCSMSGLGH